MPDPLSEQYGELLEGSYECVDRIVLNAYFRMAHSPGGFREWWRRLYGSDQNLDNAHLMRMAGRFSRRLHAWAKANQIPLVHCSPGKKKHPLGEEYLRRTRLTRGVFLILVAKAPAPVFDVSKSHHIEPKKPRPYVNHYSFHILDPDWGHVTIKICGHPPFPAQVILNGHEYVAGRTRKAGNSFTQEGNCFTHISNPAELARVADTLSEPRTVGRLSQVCERWIHSACLCFALDLEQQRRSGFHYQYSIYQAENSQNLLFRRGGQMEQVFQSLIDRNRARLGLDTIKTILGCKRRPRYCPRKKKARVFKVTVEKPTYDLTVFKLQWGKLTLKMYSKGERVLRSEVIVHNTEELDCGRSLERFPQIVARLREILRRFLQVLSCVDACWIADDLLEQLPAPSYLGKTRVGGLDFNKPRMRFVAGAVLSLATSPEGFTASAVAREVRGRTHQTEAEYGPRRAAYDLKKLRAKQMVHRIGATARYEPSANGLRALTALLVLRDKVIQPLLAAAPRTAPSQGAQNPTPLDRHYETLRAGMKDLFDELGLVA